MPEVAKQKLSLKACLKTSSIHIIQEHFKNVNSEAHLLICWSQETYVLRRLQENLIHGSLKTIVLYYVSRTL
jgi:hypothetical protein